MGIQSEPILVLDDDPEICEFVGDIPTRDQYCVSAVSNQTFDACYIKVRFGPSMSNGPRS
jgi:hypothetical protein